MITIASTPRGFKSASFTDRYGEQCSIQESSLADDYCIWLGIDNPVPKVCVYGEGWKPIELPEGAFIGGRMHLTRDMVRDLLPLLQAFVETGELPGAEEAR